MQYTLEYIAAVVPDGADYVIYPVNKTDWCIVNRYPSGNLERAARMPVYLKNHLIEGMRKGSVSVWCMQEMRFIIGSEEQLAFEYILPPPVLKDEPKLKPPCRWMDNRNWKAWRMRRVDKITYSAIGREIGVTSARSRDIVEKCNRMLVSRILYKMDGANNTPGMMDGIDGIEFVFPQGKLPHMIMPDGKIEQLNM